MIEEPQIPEEGRDAISIGRFIYNKTRRIKEMKRILLMAMAVLLIASSASAIDLQLGVETDFLLEKDVKLQNSGMDAEYSAQYYDLTAEIAVGKWLTLTPKFGLNNCEIATNSVSAISELGWNVGLEAEAVVYRDIVDVALIGEYRYSQSEIEEFDVGGLVINNPFEIDVAIHEYEFGGKVSKDLTEFGIPITPYVGLVYSDLRGDVDVNLSFVNLNEDIDAREHIGLRLGVAGEPIKDLKLGIEVDLLDQEAIIAKASYRF